MLEANRVAVLNVEHILATLRFGCEIDNAIVEVRRQPSRMFSWQRKLGLAVRLEMLPVQPERERGVWRLCGDVAFEHEARTRKRLLKLGWPISDGRLSCRPLLGRQLVVRARTRYEPVGDQSFECTITPESYGLALAGARPYLHPCGALAHRAPCLIESLACFAYPAFGLGTGIHQEHFFYAPATATRWLQHERYAAELARHSIVDRLGAFALLSGTVVGMHIDAFMSGHQNDVAFLKRYESAFLPLP
jgi:hypothetical protein